MNQNVLFFINHKAEVKYLSADMTVYQALNEMKEYKYTAVPVINYDGSYLGTITEGDFLWYIMNDGSFHTKIKHVVRKDFCKPVNVNTDINELFSQSLNQNFVPIIDDRYIFIGIVTRKKILEQLISERT